MWREYLISEMHLKGNFKSRKIHLPYVDHSFYVYLGYISDIPEPDKTFASSHKMQNESRIKFDVLENLAPSPPTLTLIESPGL